MLLMLSLIFILGVKAETEYNPCEQSPPKCMQEGLVNNEAMQAYYSSGDVMFSDEVLRLTCDHTVYHLKCLEDFNNECQVLQPLRSLSGIIDFAAELCNETSDLRQAYSAHVGCINGINFTGPCLDRFRNASRIPYEIYEALMKKEIIMECLQIYAVTPCGVEIITKNCGEDAGEVATTLSDRLWEAFLCARGDTEFYDDLFDQLLNSD